MVPVLPQRAVGEKANEPLDALSHAHSTFSAIFCETSLTNSSWLLSDSPSLAPKQLTTASFPSRHSSQLSGERASPSMKRRKMELMAKEEGERVRQ